MIIHASSQEDLSLNMLTGFLLLVYSILGQPMVGATFHIQDGSSHTWSSLEASAETHGEVSFDDFVEHLSRRSS